MRVLADEGCDEGMPGCGSEPVFERIAAEQGLSSWASDHVPNDAHDCTLLLH